MTTQEQAQKKIVVALVDLRKILTQGPKQKYPCGLHQHPAAKKLVDEIETTLVPHSETLDEKHHLKEFLECDVLPLEQLPADWETLKWLDHYLAEFGHTLPDEDWVLVSKVCEEHFPSLKRCKTFLKKHPEVHTRKPNLQRLEVNLVDWVRYWSKQDTKVSESLDKTQGAGLPEIVAADPERIRMFVEGAVKRAENVRQGKAGK